MALMKKMPAPEPTPRPGGAPTAALEGELHRLRELVSRLPALVWITDDNLRVEYAAGSLAASLGLECDLYLGQPLEQLLKQARIGGDALDVCRRALTGQTVNCEPSTHGCAVELRVEPFADGPGRPAGCLGIAWDVTERKQAEEQARFLAISDPLTGLANYRRLIEGLIHERRRSDRTSLEFALLLIDMNGLKEINDIYGHRTGNRSLCRLAQVLRESCRAIDLAARYGGDEFALLLPESDYRSAQRVARRIHDSLAADREMPPISASVGIAIYPSDAATAEQLLEAADRDLYRRKAAVRASKGALR